jgi:hypothetical protein
LIYQESSDRRSVMIYQGLYLAVSLVCQFPIKSLPWRDPTRSARFGRPPLAPPPRLN